MAVCGKRIKSVIKLPQLSKKEMVKAWIRVAAVDTETEYRDIREKKNGDVGETSKIRTKFMACATEQSV